MLVLTLLFASTFIFLNATGVITLEGIKALLYKAQNASPLIIGIVISLLLFADLFVAMPTLTIMILSGYFLGPIAGACFSIGGLLLAGFVGYGISHWQGDRLLGYLLKNEEERNKAITAFKQHGLVTILLSRAVPILPEVSACMAGLTKMPLIQFVPAWLISTIPYATIAAHAGSISTTSNPQPAIFTALGMTGCFWVLWIAFNRWKVKQPE